MTDACAPCSWPRSATPSPGARGDTPKSELRGASREMEKSMTEQELKDMAHTKRKGKPEHKGD
ncbi:hypothetical protein DPM13_01370 [Paracoccus mutanolyticus]|uniref:DUF3008 domain-containing protein n=1 Tax=Paracoccus mutanolyticus TaxID=1499308 RepID=A0ABN5M3L4_9RHOB|nr:DUF3008 family protein [Paracoccus mutanolyticus]AWX92354.1 hypothetical protein DPM13_01370 [Paracoccus mutanolyticus]